MKRTIKLYIKGDVTGVCFRSFIREHAYKLNLKGWVKNFSENEVQAVFEGNKEDTEKIIKLCKIGPITAKVESIEQEEMPVQNFRDFRVI